MHPNPNPDPNPNPNPTQVHKAALEALEVMNKLPPGWHMTKDPSSGRNYYYNPR